MTLITGKQKHKVHHGSMETEFSLDHNGYLSASTRVYNKSKLQELTGGAVIFFLDSDRHPIWTSHAHRFGVEGCWIGECDRTQGWTDTVPIDILHHIEGYSILQNQDLHWLDMLGQRRQKIALWLYSDDGRETLEEIQKTATMLPEIDRRLLTQL